MPVITALRERPRDRVEIDLDGASWRLVPADAVVRAGLSVGRALDRETARALGRELRRVGGARRRAARAPLRATTRAAGSRRGSRARGARRRRPGRRARDARAGGARRRRPGRRRPGAVARRSGATATPRSASRSRARDSTPSSSRRRSRGSSPSSSARGGCSQRAGRRTPKARPPPRSQGFRRGDARGPGRICGRRLIALRSKPRFTRHFACKLRFSEQSLIDMTTVLTMTLSTRQTTEDDGNVGPASAERARARARKLKATSGELAGRAR